MIYQSANGRYQYFIEAPNLGEAHRASRMLWGNVPFEIYPTSVIPNRNEIVHILPDGRLDVPAAYYPLNANEEEACK